MFILPPLKTTDEDRLEGLLLEFDARWTPVRFTSTVNQITGESTEFRIHAWLELVKIDLEQKQKQKQFQPLECYLGTSADFPTSESFPANLIFAEYEIRRQFGDSVELSEYARRFPRQYPQVLELVKHAAGRSGRHSVLSERDTAAVADAETARWSRAKPTPQGPPQPLTVKSEFGNRYRLLRLLGQGAMGQVYLAEDMNLSRKVALKIPTFSGGNRQELIRRFTQEAQSAARLEHPFICTIYDFGEHDGHAFITMEFVKGRPLQDLIHSRKDRLSEPSVLKLALKIARGLQHAHEADVVHRDVKPENIMIDKKLNPRIMDFGLAHQADRAADARQTRDGFIMGSPAYMSPEQVQAKADKIGPLVDIYSLGVVLFEMLTRKLPFDGPTLSVLHQITHDQPPDPRILRPEITSHTAEFCLLLLHKDPQQRPQTMADVCLVLQKLLKGQPAVPFVSPSVSSAIDSALAAFIQSPPEQTRTKPKPTASGDPAIDRKPKPKPKRVANVKGLQSTRLQCLIHRIPGGVHTLIGTGFLFLLLGIMVVVRHRDGRETQVVFPEAESIRLVDSEVVRPTESTPARAEKIKTNKDSSNKTNFQAVHSTPRKEALPPQWVDLFNRKDLTGWSGDTKYWKVEDGQLVGTVPVGKNILRYLVHDQPVGDFELEAVFKKVGRMNSGIHFRSRAINSRGSIAGIQADITIDDPSIGRLFRTTACQYHGFYLTPPADANVTKKATELARDGWHTMRIRAVGCDVQVTLNGIEVANLQDGPVPLSGHIALELSHGERTQIRFSSIRLRSLPQPSSESLQSKQTALHFGGHDWVEIPDLKYTKQRPITLEAIVRSDFAKGSVLGNMQRSGIGLEQIEGKWSFCFRDSNNYLYAKSDQKLMLKQAVHLAGVFDGIHAALYINGKRQKVSPKLTRTHRVSNRPFYLGADPGKTIHPEHFFFGSIYAVRLSNGIRYQEDFTPPLELTVDEQAFAVYDMRKSIEGDVLRNLAADKYHGKIYGAQSIHAPAWNPSAKLTRKVEVHPPAVLFSEEYRKRLSAEILDASKPGEFNAMLLKYYPLLVDGQLGEKLTNRRRGHIASGYWSTRSGEIESTGHGSTMIRFAPSFRDFIFRGEILVSPEENCGIIFRSREINRRPYAYCLRLRPHEILDWGFMARGKRLVSNDQEAPGDVWLPVEIQAIGPYLAARVNNGPVLETKNGLHQAGPLGFFRHGTNHKAEATMKIRRAEIWEIKTP